MSNKCTDSFGKEYNTQKEMCDTYGVSKVTFEARQRKHWTLRECLGIDRHRYFTDPFGKKFNTKRDMTDYYGIRVATYEKRLRLGWTQKECLGIDEHDVITDIYGNRYNSEQEMAEHYGLIKSTYTARKSYGWSLGECLGLTGRGLDAKIRDGKVINELLQIETINTRNMCVINPKDSRFYYRVRVIETNEIKYMNSDQIKAYPEGWKTL